MVEDDMNLMPDLFAILTYIALQLGTAVYVFAQGLLGRRFGLVVEEIGIGIGPAIYKGNWAGMPFRIKVWPWGGHTKFRGEEGDEEEPNGSQIYVAAEISENCGTAALPEPGVRFRDAPPGTKMAVVLIGPALYLLLGLFLLGLPVLLNAKQLKVVPHDRSQVHPSAVPGLALEKSSSTWQGQANLFEQSGLEFTLRLACFQSLEGWGSFIGFIITAGVIGSLSVAGWISSLGVVFLLQGLVNLLPVPLMNGFHFLRYLLEAIIKKQLSQNQSTAFAYIGLLVLLVYFARATWIDVRWLWHVVLG